MPFIEISKDHKCTIENQLVVPELSVHVKSSATRKSISTAEALEILQAGVYGNICGRVNNTTYDVIEKDWGHEDQVAIAPRA